MNGRRGGRGCLTRFKLICSLGLRISLATLRIYEMITCEILKNGPLFTTTIQAPPYCSFHLQAEGKPAESK